MPAPIPVHQQFSEAQKIDITRLFNEGKSAKDIGAIYFKPDRTISKLLKHLNLKRSIAETAYLCNKSELDMPDIIEKIRELRTTKSLQEIVTIVGGSISAIERLCEKYNISCPDNYSDLQSERMKKAWTEDKKNDASIKALANVTPELRKKLSDGSKELWRNPTYRENQQMKQRIVWSDVVLREKMADVLKDYWDNDDRRKAMAAVQTIIWTDDKKAKMSKIQKELWADPSRRQKISEIMRLVWSDSGLREANSNRMKKIWEDVSLRQRDIDFIKALWKTTEYREKTTDGIRKALTDPEVRSKIALATKQRWEDADYRELMAKIREAQPRVSSIQTILYDILDDLNIKYYREYHNKPADEQCTIGPYNFDCVIPRDGQKSLIIECHGDYWHSLEKSIRVDKAKSTYIARYCSDTHELKCVWEHEFGCKEKIVELIKYWLGICELERTDFNFNDLVIKKPEATEYRLLLSKYHYLANAGRGGIVHGAYLGDILIAVCVFSPPVRQNIDTREFSLKESVELSRLCIHPRYQKHNLASWFVSRCLKLLDSKYKLIISYCDTTFNHDGATYKALNFKQDKVVRSDYWYADQSGWVMHKKTLYGKAVRLSMTEAEYADKFGYKKVFGTEKLRFIMER